MKFYGQEPREKNLKVKYEGKVFYEQDRQG